MNYEEDCKVEKVELQKCPVCGSFHIERNMGDDATCEDCGFSSWEAMSHGQHKWNDLVVFSPDELPHVDGCETPEESFLFLSDSQDFSILEVGDGNIKYVTTRSHVKRIMKIAEQKRNLDKCKEEAIQILGRLREDDEKEAREKYEEIVNRLRPRCYQKNNPYERSLSCYDYALKSLKQFLRNLAVQRFENTYGVDLKGPIL